MMNIQGMSPAKFGPVKFGTEPPFTKTDALTLLANALPENGFNFPLFETQGSLYSIPIGVRYNWPTLPAEANGPQAIKIYVGNPAMANQLAEALKKMKATNADNNPGVFEFRKGFKIWVVIGESAGPLVPPFKK